MAFDISRFVPGSSGDLSSMAPNPAIGSMAPQSATPRNPYATEQNMLNYPMAMAHGGMVHKPPRGLIAVHMNPKELDILDHYQGHRKYAPDHNRMYPDLEGVFRNAHIKENLIHHAREHFASGGAVPPASYAVGGPISAANGVHGDSMVAYIGPHMKQVFNEALGHKYNRNPLDGHPQYWNLGGFLGGIGKSILGVGRNVFNKVAPIAAPIVRGALPGLTNKLGDIANNYVPGSGQFVSGLGNEVGNNLLDKVVPQGPQTEFEQNATGALQSGINNYQNYTGAGNPVNNIQDLGKAVLGGTGADQNQQNLNTAGNLMGSYLRSNPQLTPSPTSNPLLQLGHNLAMRYNNQLSTPPQPAS